VLDHVQDDGAPLGTFVRQAEAFARAVMGDEKTYECSGRENLLTQAVVEAIYLAGRTCQPESPGRLLRAAGLSAEACLSPRPVEQEPAVPADPEADQAAPARPGE